MDNKNFENFGGIKFSSMDGSSNAISKIFSTSISQHNEMMDSIARKQQEDKELEEKRHDEKIQAIKNLNKNSIGDIEKFIVNQFLNAIKLLEQRVAEIEKRGEVEISNDIFMAVYGALHNNQISICREATIGRAVKKLGETDLYISRINDGQIEELCIIENKYIENFINQYKQLLGYLNNNFLFGITISINTKMTIDEYLDKIKKDLKNSLMCLKTDYGCFNITNISEQLQTPCYLTSTHMLPDFDGKEMKIYHLVLNLYDAARKDIAKQARNLKQKN